MTDKSTFTPRQAAAWDEALPLETLDAIVEHLMADGTRAGLIHANTLNQAFGRSARRRAAQIITEEPST